MLREPIFFTNIERELSTRPFGKSRVSQETQHRLVAGSSDIRRKEPLSAARTHLSQNAAQYGVLDSAAQGAAAQHQRIEHERFTISIMRENQAGPNQPVIAEPIVGA